MKKYLIITLCLAIFSVFSAQKVQWNSFEKAQKIQTQNPEKYLFIDIYTSWCGWCKVMDKKTFNKIVISEILNTKFIPVKFNAEIEKDLLFYDKTYSFDGDYNTLAYRLTRNNLQFPTIAIVNKYGHLEKILYGYHTKEELLEELEKL